MMISCFHLLQEQGGDEERYKHQEVVHVRSGIRIPDRSLRPRDFFHVLGFFWNALLRACQSINPMQQQMMRVI